MLFYTWSRLTRLQNDFFFFHFRYVQSKLNVSSTLAFFSFPFLHGPVTGRPAGLVVVVVVSLLLHWTWNNFMGYWWHQQLFLNLECGSDKHTWSLAGLLLAHSLTHSLTIFLTVFLTFTFLVLPNCVQNKFLFLYLYSLICLPLCSWHFCIVLSSSSIPAYQCPIFILSGLFFSFFSFWIFFFSYHQISVPVKLLIIFLFLNSILFPLYSAFTSPRLSLFISVPVLCFSLFPHSIPSVPRLLYSIPLEFPFYPPRFSLPFFSPSHFQDGFQSLTFPSRTPHNSGSRNIIVASIGNTLVVVGNFGAEVFFHFSFRV